MYSLDVLYIDADILVVYKPEGISSQAERGGYMDMVSLIKNYLYTKKISYEDVYVIHRLDKPVAGILIYALNKKAAGKLSADIQSRKIKKIYKAILCGLPNGMDESKFNTEIELRDIIVKTSMKNDYKLIAKEEMSKLSPSEKKDAKEAILKYQIVEKVEFEGSNLYVTDIELITGRYHQIRLQFNGAGAPLFGDVRYNETAKMERRGVALCAYKLEFEHPSSKKIMRFEITPKNSIFLDVLR